MIFYKQNIKILEVSSSRSPSSKPPSNIKTILSKIKLFEIYPNIFAVVIKDDKLRGRIFMRYQEFYESDSETFRGKGFKWKQFVDYYKNKTKSDILTYHKDWAGYNIPCDSISSCMSLIPDINFYDLIMFSIIENIKKIVGSNKYYLIGVDQTDGENLDLIYHELAHGLWFGNKNYHNLQLTNLENLPEDTYDRLSQKVLKMQYGENVVDDEIQAYLSTGIDSSMNGIKGIKQIQIPFKETFERFAKQMSPRQIPIEWSVDLNK